VLREGSSTAIDKKWGRPPGSAHRWTPAPAARKVRTRTGAGGHVTSRAARSAGARTAGAHEVHRAVRDLRQRRGEERSFLLSPPLSRPG